MMRTIFFMFILMALSITSIAQKKHRAYVESFSVATPQGVVSKVNSTYKSAIDITDSSKCVFKSAKDQDSLGKAYNKFLMEFGRFLSAHGFKWEQTTRCWNRIYFNADGYVDYYLFDFKTEISNEKLLKYKELFTEFSDTHKIGITASESFAQCSPVTFQAGK